MHNIPPALAKALLEHPPPNNFLSWADLTQFALYHPIYGYYKQPKERVGRTKQTDFYTNISLGQAFFKLLLASIKNLLQDNTLHYHFVEVGAEPGSTPPAFFQESFRSYTSLKVGDPICIPSPAIVFSNELFDAQPFNRLLYKSGAWHERGFLIQENQLKECLLPTFTPEVAPYIQQLPPSHMEGYCLDISPAADSLLKALTTASWSGLMLIFDYGYSLEHLLFQAPQGTARAYHKHTTSSSLLDNLGMQDITYHVCWDFLTQVLADSNFTSIKLERQESFFIHHATDAIASCMQPPLNLISTLKELLFPQHMGHKFQVLCGARSK